MNRTLSERRADFKEAAQALFGPREWKESSAMGPTNAARFIQGGFLLGVSNLEGYEPGSADGLILYSSVDVSPASQVLLAAVFPNMRDVDTRLAHIGGRKNNVRFYLLEDGTVRLHSQYVDSVQELPPDPHGDLKPGRLVCAVFPPDHPTLREPTVSGFLGKLGALTGRDQLREVFPWERTVDEIDADFRRHPSEVSVEELAESIAEQGGHYVDDLVERYHLGLTYLDSKHFVILSGLSGTGKTNLAIQYARAVHGIDDPDEEDPFFFLTPVRPDWTDSTGLLGYHDVISDRYVVPPFLLALLTARAFPDVPVFICLDELNNARVEYYFAEVLSAMESGLPIPLHPHAGQLTGSHGREVPAVIRLPDNLFLTATINVDESTQPISDKVLDRAVVVDMSVVDLPGFFNSLVQRHPELEPAASVTSPVLVELHELLAGRGRAFGYRVAEEIVRYVTAGLESGQREAQLLLDEQMAQKILIKLGGGEWERDLLQELGELLDDHPRCDEVVARLTEDLDRYGGFQALR